MTRRLQIVFDSGHVGSCWAHAWTKQLAREVEEDPAVAVASVHRLSAPTTRYLASGDWLIDIELAPDADPARVLDTDACTAALHELWQLRLHPRVQVLGEP